MGVLEESVQKFVSGPPEFCFSFGGGKRAGAKKAISVPRVVHEASKQKAGLAGVFSLLYWVLQLERPPHQLLTV